MVNPGNKDGLDGGEGGRERGMGSERVEKGVTTSGVRKKEGNFYHLSSTLCPT